MIDPLQLLSAYCDGAFPMGNEDGTLSWFRPKHRGILPVQDFHVPRRFARYLRDHPFELRWNTASLAPHTEGQSPVEAAALGKPLLFGPGMSNFRTVAGELLAGGAAETVATPAALVAAATRLLADPAARASRGREAETWHARNRGAADRTLAALQPFLAPPPGA